MLEKLWNDIRLVYENFNFSSKQLIDDLMIISQDNHYLLQYKADCEPVINIRIEKNYSLVQMWSDDKDDNVTSYNIVVQVGNNGYKHEKQMIDLTYTIITPFLREAKLKKMGV
jgi:hypothetical protein